MRPTATEPQDQFLRLSECGKRLPLSCEPTQQCSAVQACPALPRPLTFLHGGLVLLVLHGLLDGMQPPAAAQRSAARRPERSSTSAQASHAPVSPHTASKLLCTHAIHAHALYGAQRPSDLPYTLYTASRCTPRRSPVQLVAGVLAAAALSGLQHRHHLGWGVGQRVAACSHAGSRPSCHACMHTWAG